MITELYLTTDLAHKGYQLQINQNVLRDVIHYIKIVSHYFLINMLYNI